MQVRAQDVEKNLLVLLSEIGPLRYALAKLEAASIRYGLYAGSHVAVLTGHRVPADVDFLVHDDDLPKLKECFPFAKTKDVGDGVYLCVGKDDIIEFMGAADVAKDGEVYPFRLTDLAVSRLTPYSLRHSKIQLVDPVDTLLLKALLKRGPEQGKHDLEDIEAVLASVQLDVTYLKARLDEARAVEFTRDIWQKLGVRV
jgi:hypothetical protein